MSNAFEPSFDRLHLSRYTGPIYKLGGIRFEFTERFGPVVVNRRTGAILDNQPGPRARFWKDVTLWNEQGRRVTPDGECIFEIPKEPEMVCIAGRHYVEVPEGETPEATRRRWLDRLGFGDRA